MYKTLTRILTVVFTFLQILVIAQNKILFVVSNQHYYGNSAIRTSNHFGEIVVPYNIFTKSGLTVDFVSPKGGAVPIGYINTSDSVHKSYLYDSYFMNKLKNTLHPSGINASNYDVIFYGGGGAAMFGVAEDTTIQRLARLIYAKKGIIASICHGTAGLVYLKDQNGISLYKGKRITGFADKFEDREEAYYKTFPLVMDEAIKKNGGNFVSGENLIDGFYIVDGHFVTGQDPSSASKMTHEIINLLSKNFASSTANLKNDMELVSETLLDYIEGTANGQPKRLEKAFHSDFNLYSVAKDSLRIWKGQEYISNFKEGKRSNRIGRILFIDIEKDTAIAKAEIKVPGWRTFTDYFLLLKYLGEWKIIHKSYSWRETPGLKESKN